MSMTTRCVRDSATGLETATEAKTGASLIGDYAARGEVNGSAETVAPELFSDLNGSCPSRICFDPEAHGLSSDFRLTKYGDLRARGTKPSRETLESCLAMFQEDIKKGARHRREGIGYEEEMEKIGMINDHRMILGEETLCTRLPGYDLHLIETNNLLTPFIEDPYAMGRLACLSVLSGIYALGIVDFTTTRMSLAIPNRMEACERDAVLPRVIRGYRDTAGESGAIVQSARITMNPWLLVGGSATAVCSKYELVPPDRAALGDVIVLTKPLGTWLALTASQWLEQPEKKTRLLLTIDENDVKKARHRALDSMLRSNREAALLMRKYNTHASCDVSAYGILGHAEMLAKRQKNPVNFVIHNLPVISKMANASRVLGSNGQLLRGVLPEHSGGLLLVLPREQAAAYCKVLDTIENRHAWIVGLVEEGERTARVIDRPRVIEVPARDTDACLCYWNWKRSGTSGPGGIILEEDSTEDRGLSVGERIAEEDAAARDPEETSQNRGSSSCGSLGQLRARNSDCSFAEESSRDDDDPYEYDEDIPRRPRLLCSRRSLEECARGSSTGLVDSPRDIVAGCSTREDVLVASGASTSSGITPCWGCRGCNPGTPFFVVGSPADAPPACISFLCSNRVSQMTKTYNDIEAVTRLLEEKEKDLELTARIGKELLTHNQKLESNVNALEAELKTANEKITQLSHELIKKTELVQILTNDVDDSGSEGGTPTGLRAINLDMMQRRISSLEDENKQLRNEFTNLVHETDDCEEQEARLVKDIAAQLANANMEVDGIADELGRQKEENRLQHEQIVSLTAKLAETELRLAQLMTEHDEVGTTLVITRDNQNTLASELADFKDRYAEVVSLLAETQEQLRKQRKRGMPTVRGGSFFPSMGAAPQHDSIASELESSLYSELSLDSGIMSDRTPAYKKVFETVRSASRTSYGGPDANQFPRIGSMTTSTLSSGSSGPRMSCGPQRPHVASGFPSLDSTGHSDSEGSLITDSEEYPGPPPTGVPGAPGAADLEAALRRLTPAEVIARRACLSTGAGYNFDYDGGIVSHSPPNFLPFGCRTPDSIMSTGSSGNLSGFSGSNHSGTSWRLPEKLQIVKPMEGSQTLHHWSQLATPTLGGLLEERPGVKTRGGRGLEDLGLETFTLADLEEDEEYANPGKLFQDTGSVYTFTNSTVLHPEDPTSVTASRIGSRVATAPSSAVNSGMNTPRTLSRRNSTSTFSTTLGLAKMLNERGIKAVTPSCVGTPSSERNFTPTATPYNSPDGSPPDSRTGSPAPCANSSLTFGLFTTGADLLKRTFSGESAQSPASGSAQRKKRAAGERKPALTRSEKKALSGIRLVEKLERIGIDAIMATTASSAISPLALQGALYSRRSNESPMQQLTFLKSSMSSEKLGSSSSVSSCSSNSASSRASSAKSRRDQAEAQNIGAKARQGTAAANIDNRLSQMSAGRQRRSAAGAGATRPDLGQVKTANAPNVPVTKESAAQSALGTISSLLFGRKGGLL